jgi:hypothetical protein
VADWPACSNTCAVLRCEQACNLLSHDLSNRSEQGPHAGRFLSYSTEPSVNCQSITLTKTFASTSPLPQKNTAYAGMHMMMG